MPQNASKMAQTLKEEAIGLARQGAHQKACAKLAKAHELTPYDIELAQIYGSALYNIGDIARSVTVLQAACTRNPLHQRTHLLLARSALAAEDFELAFAVLETANKLHPDDETVYRLACHAAAEKRSWKQLITWAKAWTEHRTNSLEARVLLARGYFETAAFKRALGVYSHVLSMAPDDVGHLIAASRIALAAQHYDEALRWLDKASALAPNHVDISYAYSRLYYLFGRHEESLDACRTALALKPEFAPAFAQIGILGEGQLESTVQDQIRALLSKDDLSLEHQSLLHFTLGDALDRDGNPEKAFLHYTKGNALNADLAAREGFAYDRAAVHRDFDLVRQIFSKEQPINDPPPFQARPIFIVAMPRSGTTLLETIFAAHSHVEAVGELPHLPHIHQELMACAREEGTNSAHKLLEAKMQQWRLDYMSEICLSNPSVSAFVDKQPINFQSVGLIRALFPEAVVLNLRRSPIDTCFSIYRHNFSKNWPCAHRLEDIGHYYGLYTHLCNFWEAQGWPQFIPVHYTDLVSDPEVEVRRLLSICGLDFEPACLAPHQVRRPVATFSAVQVRQEISTRYSGRYKAYVQYMTPLIDALKAAGVDPTSGRPLTQDAHIRPDHQAAS